MQDVSPCGGIVEVQEGAQLRIQPLGVEIAGQAAIFGDGDLPGFLRNHHGDGVRLLADAERGTMPRPELGGGGGVVREGEDDAGGDDAPVPDDRGAIMERRVRIEEIDQQLARQETVDRYTTFDIILQSRLALEDDQRAVAMPGELRGGLDQFVDGTGRGIVGARPQLGEPEPGLAELLQGAANLGLEDDGERDQQHGPGLAEDPVERGQLQGGADQEDNREQGDDAADQLGGARPLSDPQQPVDDERNHQDVDDVPGVLELCEKPPKIRHQATNGPKPGSGRGGCRAGKSSIGGRKLADSGNSPFGAVVRSGCVCQDARCEGHRLRRQRTDRARPRRRQKWTVIDSTPWRACWTRATGPGFRSVQGPRAGAQAREVVVSD